MSATGRSSSVSLTRVTRHMSHSMDQTQIVTGLPPVDLPRITFCSIFLTYCPRMPMVNTACIQGVASWLKQGSE